MMGGSSANRTLTYAGIFLVACATLVLEILLTRITSVAAWYHLAFFVISLAMLGMTAGAVYVFLRPERFGPANVPRALTRSALGFAVATPASVAFALSVPLLPVADLESFVALLGVGAVLALPFAIGGVALTLALTRAGLAPGTAYGVDLCGAATGCLVAVPLLDRVDTPSAAILAGAIAGLGAVAFARAAAANVAVPAMATLLCAAFGLANANATPPPLRPAWVKGVHEDPASFDYVRWNTHSRVSVAKGVVQPPMLWAPSRTAPREMMRPIEQRFITIDGTAGTMMVPLGRSPADHAYLGWDVTGFVHHLRPTGPAAVIGVGGGRDVLDAVRVGHRPVVGIELNDLIIGLHERDMANFSGLARLDGVELVSDEARSHLARDTRSYQTITMSLIDTWASTGVGAYSLSENALYTTEAWGIFLDRLAPTGILSVSRWYFVQSPGETARMLALAMETLWSRGADNPRRHMVMLQNDRVATLLISRTPFSDADVDRVQAMSVKLGFNMLLTPRKFPAHPLLRDLASRPTRETMWHWASQQKLDLTPPTDERPYFFNMLKPRTWLADSGTVDRMDLEFLGNLQATQTLLFATLASVLLTLCTVVGPMWARRRDLASLPWADVAAALGYFALIGLGFMLVEMALLSRLSVYLGHPTLALAVLLGGLILFTGLGSLASGRVPVERARVARLVPLAPTLVVATVGLALVPLLHATQTGTQPVRILVSLAAVAAPALCLGLCFPLGLRLVERLERAHGREPALGPWLWGINGAFGVCASGLALASSMAWGISVTLLLGAACYLVLPIATWRLSRVQG